MKVQLSIVIHHVRAPSLLIDLKGMILHLLRSKKKANEIETMNDSWNLAITALRRKSFVDASSRWSDIVVAFQSNLHFDIGLVEHDSTSLLNNAAGAPLHSFRVLDDEDLRMIDKMSEHNAMVMFDRCFSFDFAERQPLVVDRWLVSLYNASLCHHLAAFFGPPSTKMRAFRSAERLYGVCIGILREVLLHSANLVSPSVLLLLMACLNNRGHVLSHVCNQSDSTGDSDLILHCLDVLLINWSEHVTNPHIEAGHGRRLGLDNEDFSFFLYFRVLPKSLFRPRISAAA